MAIAQYFYYLANFNQRLHHSNNYRNRNLYLVTVKVQPEYNRVRQCKIEISRIVYCSVGLRILGKTPELSPVSNNETIIASGVPLGMSRVRLGLGVFVSVAQV